MAKKEKPATKLCKYCKTEIPYEAKICPNCRKKVKGGILKWILIALAVIIVIGAFGGNDSDSSTHSAQPKPEASSSQQEQEEVVEITYTEYKCTELFDDLSKNALSAEKKHQDEYVVLTGYLRVIDSDGKYISIGAQEDDYDYLFQDIQCKVTDEAQLDQILEMEMEQKITVKGQIVSIGEIMGYTLEMTEILK